MKEIIVNTAINLTKKELIKRGCGEFIEQGMIALGLKSIEDIVDLISDDLDDEDNTICFILTIKRMNKE